jgi:UDP-N-acetyl-D-mannosaminuronic acid dehydrogenase
MSKICVMGLGYIGLPVASMLASRGHEVVGFDTNPGVVASINQGKAHFFEPDLQMLLTAAVSTGRLVAASAPIEADYYILAVPTPFTDGHKPDVSYIDNACDLIAPVLRSGATIVLESTSPVGTTERLTARLAATRPDLRFPTYKDVSGEAQVFIAHCPERILPGQMVRELVLNDRIIGGMSEACAEKAFALYDTFVSGNSHLTDCRTAEFVKLIENAYRDVNIAFANELSIICDKLDIDVWSAIALANKHPRVSILQPGAGVGGHCIAVDPWFIIDSAPQEARLIRVARDVNDDKPHRVVEQVLAHAERFKKPVVACYGVTYKADVEDLRESPALEIVELLAAHDQLSVIVCDPLVSKLPATLAARPNVKRADTDAARDQADICVFLIGHKSFRRMPPNKFLNKVVVDAIGLLASKSSERN